MQRQVELIGAAWGLGGVDPGCAEAPAVLAPLLAARLEACGVMVRAGPILEPPAGERRRAFAISKLCRELAGAVATVRRRGALPCVIGGDHTCAGGTWTGVARTLSADLGLVWIEFPTEQDLGSFLDIVAEYRPGADSLYNHMNSRLRGTTAPELDWVYEINPSDLALHDDGRTEWRPHCRGTDGKGRLNGIWGIL